MVQPAIPLTGYGGWRLLQSTYDRQLENFASAPQVRRDSDHLVQAFSEPVDLETFLDDPRLRRVALTAFGLGEEAWKRGFIDKVLTEVTDPESTFLQRLNNPQYTEFASVFAPSDGVISLSPEAVSDIARRFETESFEIAVGDVDFSMRLSLNFQQEIGSLVNGVAGERAALFRMLGDVPVRTVLERALNLPTDTRQIPVERQADLLQERLQSVFGVSDLADLARPETVERVLQRFHALESAANGPDPTAPGAIALTLLSGGVGFGGLASQNLFLSRISG